MSLEIIWPLLAAIVGAVVYLVTSEKVSEIGRLTFFCGAFWVVELMKGSHAALHANDPMTLVIAVLLVLLILAVGWRFIIAHKKPS